MSALIELRKVTSIVSEKPDQNQNSQLWPMLRSVLAIWSVAVWILLIFVPCLLHISTGTLEAITINIPYLFMGLVLVGATLAAYSLEQDKHMLWFLSVLLLLAGWI